MKLLLKPLLGTAILAIASVSFAAPAVMGIPNPASVFCRDLGGISEIRTDADGSQYGVCKFDDNRIVEEWQLYRNSSFDVQTVNEPAINGSTDVQAKYPKLRDQALTTLNRKIERFVRSGISQTKSTANIPGSEASQLTSYSSTFEAYASTGTVSVVLFTEQYTGGAHPIDEIKVFNADKAGRPLALQRYLLGSKKSLEEFAARTQIELLAKYKDHNFGKKAVMEATAAKWSNFTRVAIDGDSAIVYFPTYTLWTRVDGSQTVKISLNGIKTLDSR